jgi:hypothetical protein
LCHQCMYSICMLILNKIMLSWNMSVSSVKQLSVHFVYGRCKGLWNLRQYGKQLTLFELLTVVWQKM